MIASWRHGIVFWLPQQSPTSQGMSFSRRQGQYPGCNNPIVAPPWTQISLSSLPGGFHVASHPGAGVDGACGVDGLRQGFVSRSGHGPCPMPSR